MLYFIREVDHKQTYTPLFDREKFLPSPLFVERNTLALMARVFLFIIFISFFSNTRTRFVCPHYNAKMCRTSQVFVRLYSEGPIFSFLVRPLPWKDRRRLKFLLLQQV
jgi:hypothetical protein